MARQYANKKTTDVTVADFSELILKLKKLSVDVLIRQLLSAHVGSPELKI